jgi:hemoglobin
MKFCPRLAPRGRGSAWVAALALALALSGCAALFPARHVTGAAGASPRSPLSTPASSPAGATASSVASAPAPAAPALRGKPLPSLYRRLGGYDAIAAFTDDFLGRATNDPVIIPFFRGLSTAELQRIRQLVVDQLCAATGGPCFYPGRDMKTAHADLEITNDVWNAFTGHLNETVARFRIADRERNELVAIVASLKPDIVNK